MLIPYYAESISYSSLRALTLTGEAITTLVADNVSLFTKRNNVSTEVVLHDLTSITDDWEVGGFIHWSNGWYRADLPNHLWVPGSHTVVVSASFTGSGTIVSCPINLYVSPVGSGLVFVNQDYGGTDALRVLDPSGDAVDNCLIQARFTGETTLRGETYSNAAGRWAFPLMLYPGEYEFNFIKTGFYLKTRPITVN